MICGGELLVGEALLATFGPSFVLVPRCMPRRRGKHICRMFRRPHETHAPHSALHQMQPGIKDLYRRPLGRTLAHALLIGVEEEAHQESPQKHVGERSENSTSVVKLVDIPMHKPSKACQQPLRML
eukprot:1048296-Amphidinium_carterae.1